MESTRDRKAQLTKWLNLSYGKPISPLAALPHDASTRRYYRLTDENQSFIVMDAPPPHANFTHFIALAHFLRAQGLHAPEIFASELNQGFLLLSDFGDDTYLKILNAQNANELYERALGTLFTLKNCQPQEIINLPLFSKEFMQEEWALHQEWFLDKWLGVTLPQMSPRLPLTIERIIDSALSQPQVFMHRDFHSANLMALANGGVGILDFQDAFYGPLTYDVVSLLRDCYINWPIHLVEQWVAFYYQLLQNQNASLSFNFPTFLQWFDWMGIQRHLKALMTFARKVVRDQDSRYLKSVPRTLNYILTVSRRYDALHAIYVYYRALVPLIERKLHSCVP